jgi:hypothetical protein
MPANGYLPFNLDTFGICASGSRNNLFFARVNKPDNENSYKKANLTTKSTKKNKVMILI